MIKTLLSFLTVTILSFGAMAQNVNIPDANFKAYLVGNTLINTNGDTEIQVSEATAFTGIINCNSQSISDLTGIEAFTALTYLWCYSNQLTTLDITNNTALISLSCGGNQLTSLDVTNNTVLTELICQANQLTNLDVSNNINLMILKCNSNPLGSLNVSNNTSLTYLWCYSNQLTTLDITNNTALISSICGGNQLTSLDVTNNTVLTELICQSNQLTSLDVSNNITLMTLRCNNNQLGSLNVSNNTSLTDLHCYTNQLTILDVSNNITLITLLCNDNQLTSLNVANGNNTNFVGINASNNSNLTCIQVDNVTYSTTNWTQIDAQTSFSTNCVTTVLVSSITIQGQGGVSTITTQGGTLQMEATVLPANADDGSYAWSVFNQTGSATIDANGLLTASTDGIVAVTATANDASGETASIIVTISNQSLSVNENNLSSQISIYPNPVKNQLFIELDNQKVTEITIIDYSGRVVKTINSNVNTINVSDLQQGIYILKVATENGVLTNRFIKQ